MKQVDLPEILSLEFIMNHFRVQGKFTLSESECKKRHRIQEL